MGKRHNRAAAGAPLTLSLALVALMLAGCGRGQAPAQSAAPPPQVTVAKPTVRTIVDQTNRRDRTTVKHRKRLEQIDTRQQRARWKRQRRVGDALPKRVQAVVKEGLALAKEARGLGRP